MRLLFAGTPDSAVPSLDRLNNSRHTVVAVLTRPDARVGRGRKVKPSPVKQYALDHGIEVLTPSNVREEGFRDQLDQLDIDCAPVTAFGALLPADLLGAFKHGWVNLHFSLLPAWRGAAPVQYAIWHGDEVTGCTTFQIETGMDTGPVFGMATERVHANDTTESLMPRLVDLGATLLVSTMDAIESGTARPQPQSHDGVSYAAKVTTADALVDWTQPSLAIDRHVRALTPAPGAWSVIDLGESLLRLRFGPVTMDGAAEPTLAPGEIAVTKNHVRVGTGSGTVVLGTVAPAGRAHMSAADWARGARLPQHAHFVDKQGWLENN